MSDQDEGMKKTVLMLVVGSVLMIGGAAATWGLTAGVMVIGGVLFSIALTTIAHSRQ